MNDSKIPVPPLSAETRRISGNFQRALLDPESVSIRASDYKIIGAMSRGAVLRDVYRPGRNRAYKPREEARTLTMPNGTSQHVTRPAITRLRTAGLIATPDSFQDIPHWPNDVTWRLTAAGLAASPNPDAAVET